MAMRVLGQHSAFQGGDENEGGHLALFVGKVPCILQWTTDTKAQPPNVTTCKT
jgi:hypothetical protein